MNEKLAEKSTNKSPISGNKFALPVLLAASMLTLMGGAAVAPALPKMAQYFSNMENAEYLLSFMVTLPSLAIALSSPFMGILADKYGKNKLLIISLALFSFSGVSGAYLESLEIILAGRFILGIAIGGMTICATSLITDYYTDPAKRHKIYGMQSAAMGIGCLVLEGGGGGLAEFSWRYPFFIYLLALPIMLGAFSLQEPAKNSIPKNESKLSTSKNELKIGSIAFVYFAMFLAMTLMFIVPSKGPFLFAERGITSSLVAGLILGVMGVANTGAALLQVRLSDYLGEMERCALGIGLTGLGLFLLSINSMPAIAAGAAIVGIGTGVVQPTLISWIGLLSPQHLRGRIFGGLTSILFLGQFASSMLMQPLIGSGISLGDTIGYFGMIGIAAAVIMVAGKTVAGKIKDLNPGFDTNVFQSKNVVYDEED